MNFVVTATIGLFSLIATCRSPNPAKGLLSE